MGPLVKEDSFPNLRSSTNPRRLHDMPQRNGGEGSCSPILIHDPQLTFCVAQIACDVR